MICSHGFQGSKGPLVSMRLSKPQQWVKGSRGREREPSTHLASRSSRTANYGTVYRFRPRIVFCLTRGFPDLFR